MRQAIVLAVGAMFLSVPNAAEAAKDWLITVHNEADYDITIWIRNDDGARKKETIAAGSEETLRFGLGSNVGSELYKIYGYDPEKAERKGLGQDDLDAYAKLCQFKLSRTDTGRSISEVREDGASGERNPCYDDSDGAENLIRLMEDNQDANFITDKSGYSYNQGARIDRSLEVYWFSNDDWDDVLD